MSEHEHDRPEHGGLVEADAEAEELAFVQKRAELERRLDELERRRRDLDVGAP